MFTLTKEALEFEVPFRQIPGRGGIPVRGESGSAESALLTHIAGLTIHPGVLEIIRQSQLPPYRALYRQLRNEAFGLVEWAVRHPDEFTEANRVLILPYFPHIAGELSEIERSATPGYNFGNPQAAIYRELEALSRSSSGSRRNQSYKVLVGIKCTP